MSDLSDYQLVAIPDSNDWNLAIERFAVKKALSSANRQPLDSLIATTVVARLWVSLLKRYLC